ASRWWYGPHPAYATSASAAVPDQPLSAFWLRPDGTVDAWVLEESADLLRFARVTLRGRWSITGNRLTITWSDDPRAHWEKTGLPMVAMLGVALSRVESWTLDASG